MKNSISRELMGKVVDEVFGGAIEDPSVIEEIYACIKRHEDSMNSKDEIGKIQKDVREKAKEVFKTIANTYGSHEKMYEPIAIAIMEEREKCAVIAENGPRSPTMIALLIRGKPYGWMDKRNN